MTAVLVTLSIVGGLIGFVLLSQATAGIGTLAGAILIAILARLSQASDHHHVLKKALAEKLPTSVALLVFVLAWPLVVGGQSAKASIVALRIVSLTGQQTDKTMTIRLESGTVIVVPTTDIDFTHTPTPELSLQAQQPSSTVIRAKCAKDWPADFAMRAFCEKQQREAVSALDQRAMARGDRLTIRTKCTSDWPDDFSLRDFCEKQQLEALEALK